MRQINGVYTQTFNRRHGLTGHLFQGRFKAILVDSDSYLLEVCRYVDLNPVRAQMVRRPDAYAWSSYRALAGLAEPAPWLDRQPMYEQLSPGKSAAKSAALYADFVSQGHGVKLWDTALTQQIYLGDDAFVARMQSKAGIGSSPANASGHAAQVSRIHTSAPQRDGDVKSYAAIKTITKDQRNQNIANAFYQGGHSQTAISLAFGVSTSTVSRIVADYERQ
jgi:putative transposase